MVIVDEYFRDLMKKILGSYDIIKNLGDSKEDFFILNIELTKINGLFRVLLRKSEEFSDRNPEFSKLTKKIQNYFDNYYFIGELEKLKKFTLRIRYGLNILEILL